MTDTTAAVTDHDADAAGHAIELVQRAARLADSAGREDLRDRLTVAAVRLANPSTVVCIVGEFKQGKSLLVNAILGTPICPVDDDLATSVVTAIQYADKASVTVLRREGAEHRHEQISAKDLADYVTERGNPGNERNVDQVAIGFPHPLLKQGFAFVDTPGVGGLGAGHAAATLAFLPYADALVLVSDASSELSSPELELLGKATALCPNVVHVLSKTDLFVNWRHIAELNRGHLDRTHPEITLIPTSAAAAIAGLELDDPTLAAESGIGDLITYLQTRALDRARTAARVRAFAEAREAINLVVGAAEQELAMLRDGKDSATDQRELDEVVAHLEHLRGPGSRWSQRLGDAVGDIANGANFEFRQAMRTLGRDMDEEVEKLASPKDWDDLSLALQSRVADAVTAIFQHIDDQIDVLRGELVELLELEALPPHDLAAANAGQAIDEIWLARIRELKDESGAKKTAGQAVTALRGAQSGLMLLTLLGKFLPAGAAALLFSNPVTAVLVVALVGKHAFDIKKKNVAARRQQAKANIRGFIDDVQFEVGNDLGELIRTKQRGVRDEFSELVTTLQRTYSELGERARQNVASTTADRDRRAKELERLLDPARPLSEELAAAVAQTPKPAPKERTAS